jgi:hypothetical protein
MALEVIGAGLGRTGTLSLKVALEELGFSKCYHMTEVFANPHHVASWAAAGRGEPVDWDALFRGYRATVDWPGCNFYREFLARNPDARVILTVRDPDRWYDSANRTIYRVHAAFPGWLRLVMPRMRRFFAMVDSLIWDGFFQGRFADRAFAIDRFRRHIEEVRQNVPTDRLLVYEVKDGWGPLCGFLGVPVPEGKPFPHVNDTAEFQARIRAMSRLRRAVATGLGLAAVAIVGLLAWWLSRSRN